MTNPEIDGRELLVCLWDQYCSQNKLLLVFSRKIIHKHSKISKMWSRWAGNFGSFGFYEHSLIIPSSQMFSANTAHKCLTTFTLTTLWHIRFHVSWRVESWALCSYLDVASHVEIGLELWSVWAQKWRNFITWGRACTAILASLMNSGGGRKQTNTKQKIKTAYCFSGGVEPPPFYSGSAELARTDIHWLCLLPVQVPKLYEEFMSHQMKCKFSNLTPLCI